MDIVSWQPVLTDHQSYTLEALKRAARGDMTVYVSKREHSTRSAQGWVNRHASSLSPQVVPQFGWIRRVRESIRKKPDAVHLFGSPFDQVPLIAALMVALAMRARVFLISEPYSPISAGYLDDRNRLLTSVKARLRPIVYRGYGALIRRRIAGVFAISPLAVSQYRLLGIPSERIHPFGYFIPRSTEALAAPRAESNGGQRGLRVVFVGSLTARKGLDIAIEAVKGLTDEGVAISLDAYGPGDPSGYKFDQVATHYRGRIPFGSAQAVISTYDLLVVPSRYDGWGVVVNEALLAGVPLVCSDAVGAGVVVGAWGCGAIFRSGDVTDLKARLRALASDPAGLARAAAAVKEAGEALDPELAGRFMYDVISGSAAGTSGVHGFTMPASTSVDRKGG